MKLPLQTPRERGLAVGLVVLWALLFLPELRTNPNWYSDEGEWMEKCWTFVHGTPRVGPVKNDFLYPYPYPPLYMLANGALLRVFGNDIAVGRAFGAVTALAAAALLFWIGTRLKDKNFGFLCAAVFLVYPETVMNFRWVRAHPMAGVLALASIGFLVRYVQEKVFRDVVWAGTFCALATATNYFAYPLIPAVIATVALVNPATTQASFSQTLGLRLKRAVVAGAVAGAYGVLFCLWYVSVHGSAQFTGQLQRLTTLSPSATDTFLAELARLYRNAVTFLFLTPTVSREGAQYVDVWLIVAAAGLVVFPVARFRKWLVFWTAALMYAVFKQMDNVPLFFYPATMFLALLAVAGAGALVRLGQWGAQFAGVAHRQKIVAAPVAVFLVVFGLLSLSGSLGHFRTKVDPWAIHSPRDAEAAMEFVNARTTGEDYVVVPKHLYWAVGQARKGMLPHCVAYEGKTDGVFPGVIPQERYWFDCRWENAKYIVLAYGRNTAGRPYGFDAVYSMGFAGIRRIVESVQSERWPVVFQQGEFMVLANPRFMEQ